MLYFNQVIHVTCSFKPRNPLKKTKHKKIHQSVMLLKVPTLSCLAFFAKGKSLNFYFASTLAGHSFFKFAHLFIRFKRSSNFFDDKKEEPVAMTSFARIILELPENACIYLKKCLALCVLY